MRDGNRGEESPGKSFFCSCGPVGCLPQEVASVVKDNKMQMFLKIFSPFASILDSFLYICIVNRHLICHFYNLNP